MACITDIRANEIERIRELWERNRQYHIATTENFTEEYARLRFEDRMAPLIALPEDRLKVSIVLEGDALCGYCISTAQDGVGELVSLHVLESTRGKGVGKQLSGHHLQWMKEKGCDEITVQVTWENISAIRFYQSLGFCPNIVTMQLKRHAEK